MLTLSEDELRWLLLQIFKGQALAMHALRLQEEADDEDVDEAPPEPEAILEALVLNATALPDAVAPRLRDFHKAYMELLLPGASLGYDDRAPERIAQVLRSLPTASLQQSPATKPTASRATAKRNTTKANPAASTKNRSTQSKTRRTVSKG